VERKTYKEITDALNKAGITVVDYADGKKHGKMTITDGTVTVFIVTHNSSCNRHAIKNLVSDAKRTLAEHRPK
jgi:hypothetical protein